MAVRKRLETISGINSNQSKPKFAAKKVANEKRCQTMSVSLYRPKLVRLALSFNQNVFLSNIQNQHWLSHISVYSILRVLSSDSSHFSKLDDPLNEHQAKMCEAKILQFQFISDAIMFRITVYQVLQSRILVYLVLIRTCSLVVTSSQIVADDNQNIGLVRIQQSGELLCSHLASFA